MSFVRFGSDGSQVYIYDDVHLGPVCCGCSLSERLPDRTDAEIAGMWVPAGMSPEFNRQRWAPDFATSDLEAMLAHVAEHRAAGHVVPEWLDQRLRDEWDQVAGGTAPSLPPGEHVNCVHELGHVDPEIEQICSPNPFPTTEVTPAEIAEDLGAIDRANARAREAESGRVEPGAEWICPACGYHNAGGICTHCGRPLNDTAPSPSREVDHG